VSVIIAIDRAGTTHHVDATPGRTIMEILRDEGLGIEALCGGQGACATCHCYVTADWYARLPAPGTDELDLLDILDTKDPARSRLTCQDRFDATLDGLELTIAPEG
jgi:2Fe-2S ferredoxin